MVAHRPIDARGDYADSQAEIKFLEYRREVIDAWPESPRKKAAMEGIGLRLRSLRGKAS